MQLLKYALLPASLFWALGLPAQSAHQLRRTGDKAYQQSNYREAEQAYREAEALKPGDPALHYNTGNALYRQGNYEASEPFFDKAAQTVKDPNKQADAWHNLGNSYLMQKKYQEAVEAYENSLRARPGDPDSKVNLQFAKKKLKQQQAQQPNQQNQQQPQEQQNQSGEQPPQDQQNKDPNQQNPPPGGEQQNQAPPNQQNAGEPNQQQLSPEQARRLLETAVAPADKQNARKYREQEPGKHQVQPKKDW